jgi:2-methylcitrate dehydratase PrpD
VVDEEFERRYPAHYSCAVTVTMDDGTEYTSVIDDPKGDFRNPVTQQELEAKFLNLAQREIKDEAKIRNIISFVNNIGEAKDVAELFRLMA